MTPARRRVVVAPLLAGVLLLLVPALGPGPVDVPGAWADPAPGAAVGLPLGPAGLAESRVRERLQPGVSLTTIVRGVPDGAHRWTVELNVPPTGTAPDPTAAPAPLSDRASATVFADRVRAAGFAPRVEPVDTPPTSDYRGGRLGWRVRVGGFTDQAAADAERARLSAAGFTGASRFTGWDGASTDRGPWRIQVLTVDPERFRGSLLATYGPDLEQRETTSALSRATGATAAVNGGYFVLDPASGAPGDPAGVGVYGGALLSETVGRRPALILREDASRTRVARLTWSGAVRGAGAERLPLDGVNRVPGLIRNCGGTADDLPTALPRHDFTCTDDGEVVVFTSAYGRNTPAGPGVEAILDRASRVVALRAPRGGPLLSGYRAVQATGALVDDLEDAAPVGQRLRITTQLRGPGSVPLRGAPDVSVVNGGPELVRDGRLHVTPRADGFVRATDPSFYYGFSAKRNPRTFAGIDRLGRTVLVTADGRSTSSLGLTIVETGRVARALGLRDALNLDGGGSTTMVVDGAVVNQPSDATGERPVGDAVLVLPR